MDQHLAVHDLGRTTWLHNIKCRTTHVAHTVHTTTTTCFMSHNHVVPSRTINFLSVWTHLETIDLFARQQSPPSDILLPHCSSYLPAGPATQAGNHINLDSQPERPKWEWISRRNRLKSHHNYTSPSRITSPIPKLLAKIWIDLRSNSAQFWDNAVPTN